MEFLLLLCVASLNLVSAFPDTGARKIVGGVEVSQGQFPSLVSLQNAETRQHFCGGAIISDRLIVTAAHCFFQNLDPTQNIAYVGSIDLTSGGTVHQLKRIVVHEDYDDDLILNDIGLLQTAEPIQLGPNATPVKLPAANISLPVDTLVTALGWGALSYPDVVYPSIANYIEDKVVTNDFCADRLETGIPESQICAGGVNGMGLCGRDSGSPLLLNGNTTVGIVSWGRACGIGYPDAFTRMSSYVDWVQRNSILLNSMED